MRRFMTGAAIVGLLGWAAMPARAGSIITYTETVDGVDGLLGSTVFDNADVTITATADPSAVSASPDGKGGTLFSNTLSSLAVTITGVPGTATFSVTDASITNDTSSQGLEINNLASLLSQANANGNQFNNYDLATAIEPVTGPGDVSIAAWATSLGTLKFESTDAGDTFSAAISTASVPEPSSMMLAGIGLGAVALFARRRGRA